MPLNPNPNARPFSPRHRPPPIKVQQQKQQQIPAQDQSGGVSFAPSPQYKNSSRKNERFYDGQQQQQRMPRTPFPPGVKGSRSSTPNRVNSSYPRHSQQSQQVTQQGYAVMYNNAEEGTPPLYTDDKAGDVVDAQAYAGLLAKQQEMLASSMYAAQQQQQKLQAAMMQNVAAQQQQQQQQYYGGYGQYYQQSPQQQLQYVQDQDGNYWYVPTQTPDLVQYSQYSSASASPARINSPLPVYGVDTITGGKQKKGHRRTASASTDKRSPSPATPYNPAFDEYKVAVGTRTSTANGNGSGANGANGAEMLPSRQPMLPITLEELKKSVHGELNFWSVGVSRLDVNEEGRCERGKAVVEVAKVDYAAMKAAWGLEEENSKSTGLEKGIEDLTTS
ncbi:uncharacterized protein V2V93DRAFT_368589 [Kockiozyma suomiensis]|uniref:uncharacterized protein n=1 Tax=Kockiozyma suomiensis TaxID=1337062 RepID=UPI0033443773